MANHILCIIVCIAVICIIASLYSINNTHNASCNCGKCNKSSNENLEEQLMQIRTELQKKHVCPNGLECPGCAQCPKSICNSMDFQFVPAYVHQQNKDVGECIPSLDNRYLTFDSAWIENTRIVSTVGTQKNCQDACTLDPLCKAWMYKGTTDINTPGNDDIICAFSQMKPDKLYGDDSNRVGVKY